MRRVRSALAGAALAGAAMAAVGAAPAAAAPDDPGPSGYWLVGADGGVFNYGAAGFHGSMGDEVINEPVVGMAAAPSGSGYWQVALDGGVFAFGDAGFLGSMGDRVLNEPMIGIAATPGGGGYWTVATDGGVFAFGDADFYGSMGDQPLNAPVVGIVPTPTGEGYWLVAEDGGVFNYGDAPFAGSLGGDPPDEAVVGLAGVGEGYVTVTQSGQLDAFGTEPVGSLAPADVAAPIVGVADDPTGDGFWLAAADGVVHAVGGAEHHDDARDLPLNGPIMAIAATAPGGDPVLRLRSAIFSGGTNLVLGDEEGEQVTLRFSAPVVLGDRAVVSVDGDNNRMGINLWCNLNLEHHPSGIDYHCALSESGTTLTVTVRLTKFAEPLSGSPMVVLTDGITGLDGAAVTGLPFPLALD